MTVDETLFSINSISSQSPQFNQTIKLIFYSREKEDFLWEQKGLVIDYDKIF